MLHLIAILNLYMIQAQKENGNIMYSIKCLIKEDTNTKPKPKEDNELTYQAYPQINQALFAKHT